MFGACWAADSITSLSLTFLNRDGVLRLARYSAICIFMLACSQTPPAEELALLFLDQYLVAADQRSAITLTVGRAKVALQKEIDLLSSLEGRDQELMESRPTVTFEKLEQLQRANGDVALQYRVVIDRSDYVVPDREVFVLVGLINGEYRVKSFSFRSPSDSRTSNTP